MHTAKHTWTQLGDWSFRDLSDNQ